MSPVCSLFMHKNLLSIAQPLHQCREGIFPIKNKSCAFQLSNSQRRQFTLIHGRKLCQKSLCSQQCVAHYTRLKNSYKLYRNLSAVHPPVIYGMERNPNSNSRNINQIAKSSAESNGPPTDTVYGQLNSLDSYLSQVKGDASEVTEDLLQESNAEKRSMPDTDKNNTSNIASELGSLDNYFDKLNTNGPHPKSESTFARKVLETSSTRQRKFLNEETNGEDQSSLQRSIVFHQRIRAKKESSISFEDRAYEELDTDEPSYFYLTNLLAAVDIAAFLFGEASPVKNPNFGELTLPLLYGAKDNELILDGEWWRLVTPMFLHPGIPQLVLSCWVLLTFGPQVCRAYGPFTFFLIYLLGGICSNTISFIHIPELTVSGTGPIFAIIGAWLVYQFQNKEAISNEVSDDLYLKAIVATIVSFFLADSMQIDQWTHLSAAVSGVVYGFFTCPTMHPNDSSPKEEAAMTPHQADPRISALTFAFFISAFFSLAYVFMQDLDISDLGTFLE